MYCVVILYSMSIQFSRLESFYFTDTFNRLVFSNMKIILGIKNHHEMRQILINRNL